MDPMTSAGEKIPPPKPPPRLIAVATVLANRMPNSMDIEKALPMAASVAP